MNTFGFWRWLAAAQLGWLLAFFLLATTTVVRADKFEWSYTFSTGELCHGLIEADYGDTYLENFTYASFLFVSADGRANRMQYVDDPIFFKIWPPQIPKDGSMLGLNVDFEHDMDGDYLTSFGIYTLTGAGEAWIGSLSMDAFTQYDGPEVFYGNPQWASEKTYESDYYYINYRRNEGLLPTWTLRPVPDSGGTGLLIGLSFLGWVTGRRMFRRRL